MAGGARALPDLIARIRVDSSGVDAGINSLIKSFGKADLALAGVAAGIGLLVLGGKSMIEISEKHEAAENSLAQALATRAKATKTVTGPTADATKLTDALHAAARRLSEFDVSHRGHTLTAAQLMHRQDLLAKVASSTRELARVQASSRAVTVSAAIDSERFNVRLEQFIRTNRQYISSQSEVIDGAAKLVRMGLSEDEIQKDLNRATDLAALKHISYSEAVDLLTKAEQGRLRGLIDLGVSTGKYTDAQGNLINGTKDVGRAMTELDNKTKGGRNTLTDLQRHSNILSNDWQDLSNKGGPVLLILLDKVVAGVTSIYDWFDRIGKDDGLWGAISDRLVKMASWIKQYVIDPLNAAGTFINTPTQQNASNLAANAGRYGGVGGAGRGTSRVDPAVGKGGRASGGPVIPGGVYSVGEESEETLVMYPGGGGTVIPGRGRRGGGSRMAILPVVFSPIPPNREQLLVIREHLRRIEREGR